MLLSEFCYKGKEQAEIDESKKKKEPIIKIERSEIVPESKSEIKAESKPVSTGSVTDLPDDGFSMPDFDDEDLPFKKESS